MRLDHIHSFLGGIQFLTSALGVLVFIALCYMFAERTANEQYNKPDQGYIDPDYYKANQTIRWLRWPFAACILTALACSIATTFIPTTKEMAAIKVVPVLAGPEIAEKLKTMSSDMVDIAAQWLKDTKEKRK